VVSYNNDGVSDRVIAVIPAAGLGTRMCLKRSKQFVDLCGKPILAVTLDHFQRCGLVDDIILVVSRGALEFCRSEIVDRYKLSKVSKVIVGGTRRQDSVRKGVESVPDSRGWILIHDGARPLISVDLIERVITAAQTYRAVIMGIPIKDTVKEIDTQGSVVRSIDRRYLRSIQTPQIFRCEDIRLAHKRALREGWDEATDDACLIEKMGISVEVIEGDEANIKITTLKDLEIARLLLSVSGEP
jgi:2-C-methyl-D-erythritol 4-phosphate cytidylyltransferase